MSNELTMRDIVSIWRVEGYVGMFTRNITLQGSQRDMISLDRTHSCSCCQHACLVELPLQLHLYSATMYVSLSGHCLELFMTYIDCRSLFVALDVCVITTAS